MKTLPLAFLVVLLVAFISCSSTVSAQCEPGLDCNQNGSDDSCDIADNTSNDCDGDGIPDECQIAATPSLDCNQDSILDSCEGSLEDTLTVGTPGVDYGESIAMSGDLMVVGAAGTQSGGIIGGGVHVYQNNGSRWIHSQMITPPDATNDGMFGLSVDIDGDVLIVGAPGSTAGSLGEIRGAAYIYRLIGSVWTFEQKLEASDGAPNDEFGISVGLSGDRAVVGAWRVLNAGLPGSAYIFSHDGTTWNQDQTLISSDASGVKRFGGAVGIDGNTLIVADQRADLGFLQQVGGVYVYTSISQTSWLFTQKITAQDPQENSQFGRSIALEGDRILVGSPITDGANGAAYVFEKTGFIYNQTHKFSQPALDNAQLGITVSMSGDSMIYGAWRADGNIGSIFVSETDGAGGYVTTPFVPAVAVNGDRFGISASASGRWVAAGSSSTEYVVIDRMISAEDCNQNGVDDPCDVFSGTSQDCDLDGTPDSCQIANGTATDCDGDLVPDHCQLADGSEEDCNNNGVIDSCDIAGATSDDCNGNSIPDDCEDDCNLNGIADSCEIANGTQFDCNGNGFLDECDLMFGFAIDCNSNQIPDSCDLVDGTADDCNGNNALDICEITIGIADDCNGNLQIDQCELDSGLSSDCNGNLVPDFCDIAYLISPDCNGNMLPDECELASGALTDCNANGIPDNCELLAGTSPDCNTNGLPDECDVATGALDCNANGIPDTCEVQADPNPPVIAGLPAEVVVTADLDTCSAVAIWDPAVITDDCGISTTFSSHTSGSTFPVGSTPVSVTATDVSGNVTGHTFNVVVVDAQLPVLSGAPANISIDNDPGMCTALVSWTEPSASDNCLNTTITTDHDSGSAFTVGTTTVTYTATDDSGNNAQHSFEVTVNDVDLPSISGLPGTVIVNSNPGLCTALVSWGEPTVTDNCPGSTFASDHQPGDAFPVGTTLITYTATDASGNESTSSFDLTVVDDELPQITGVPSSAVLSSDPGSCGAQHSWAAPVATDNCGAPAVTLSHNSGDFFPIGTTNVTLLVEDANGNTLDFNFDVIVNDTEMPVITGVPTSSSHLTEPGQCTRVIEWAMPTVSDNCESPTLIESVASGTAFPVGDTEVTYTATDANGNIVQESFIISVSDEELPTLDGVPVSMSADSTSGLCGALVAWPDPVVGDNCGIDTFTTTHEPGSTFDVGLTTVTYEVTDVNGNQVTQSFDVSVTDIESPQIADMPADILLDSEPGSCSAAATWALPTSTDNCAVSSLTSDRQSGEQFDVGVTTVTYTSVDLAGLETTASFQVTVEDHELPTIDGLVPSVTFTNTPGSCDAVATWTAPTSSDNCGTTTLTSTHEPGWVFTVGDTIVSYTAEDQHGNLQTAQILVTVLDEEAPSFAVAPTPMALDSEPGTCTAMATWTEPTVLDNCEVQTVDTTHPSGTIFPVGTTTVTYTATDIHSNVMQHSFDVTVSDMELPQILDVPATLTLDSELDLCTAMATWNAPSATDNCGVDQLTSSHNPGDTFPVGTTTVTLTATDIHANTRIETFDVVVSDNQAPQINGMPANIALNSEPGLCSAVASWVDPTGSDNCGIDGLSTSHTSGAAFDVGTTDVIFTMTDIHGNQSEATMQITVTDAEAPQITNLPERVTVPTVAGTCEGTTSWTDPDTADNCGIASLETDIASGSSLPVGETVVTYIATDLNGNTTSQSFIVTVADQELPELLDMPTDMTIPTDAGLCTGTGPWTAPTAQDNCGIDTLVASHQPGDAMPKGSTTVSITATDIHGNIHTETFLVTVVDDELPVIIGMPADITMTADLDQCGALVTWTPPTTGDNCDDDVTLVSTHEPGAFFPVGSTEVTYTATDDDENSTSASFTITVTDDQAPAISGLSADLDLLAEAGVCTASATWAEPGTSDNCGVASVSSSHASGDSFPVGVTTVMYTVTDVHGNETSDSFIVTITDDQAPEFVGLPERVTVPSEPGSCTAAVSWAAPTATDNCELAGITLSHTSGDQFPVGDTVVDLIASDIHGNDTAASFIVTVEDLEDPAVLGTPADISLSNDLGDCGAIAGWDAPSASDNCGVQSLTSSHTSGDFFAVGSTEVTLIATDIHGNSASTSFMVNVADTEDPSITGMPADMSLTAEPGLCSAAATWTAPTSSDNCGIAGLTSSHNSGDSFPVGTTEVTYSTTDIHGNESSASFLITITDDEAPTIINLPERVTIPTEPGTCEGIVNWIEPDTSDNCGVASLEVSIPSGTPLPVGDTPVTYTVTDIHGNTHSEDFVIGVEDLELPQIVDTPADIMTTNDAGSCGASVTWVAATATDNCGVQSLTSTHTSGEAFPVGTTEVSLLATDIHGNTSSSSFLVTVTDDEDPTIAGIPADMTLTAESDMCSAVASWAAPTSSDNCGIADLTSTSLPGDTFPVGVTEVTYSTSDLYGNEVSDSFLITVTDDQEPSIDGLPTSMTLSAEAGLCSATATWTIPGSSDNCQVESLISDHQSGDSFPVGSTVVTYTALDIHGNSSSEAFTVTVNDEEDPVVLDTPMDMTLSNDAGDCGALVNWAAPSAGDNCGVQSLTSSHTSGDFFAVGTTEVTLEATDIHGNSASTSFLVTITDDEDPSIAGMPADMSITAEAGLCSAAATWAAPTSSDNCEIADLTSTHLSGDSFAVGTTEVIYSTTDIHGNGVSASFLVTVTDDQAPSFDSLTGDISVSNETGLCSSQVTWSDPVVSDNCEVAAVTTTIESGSVFAVGTTEVLYTLTDIHGNMTTQSFQVTVTDDEYPLIHDVPADISISSDAGLCGASVSWVSATTTDNCDVANLVETHTPGEFFPVGTTPVTYASTDLAGNRTLASFDVTVIDTEDPQINGLSNMTVSNDTGTCGAAVTWTAPDVTDNCAITSFQIDHASGDIFPVGVTTVSATAIDENGNSTTVSFDVTVQDDENPQVLGTPDDITLDNDAGQCGAVATWSAPSATDNCGSITLQSTHQSGDQFPVGLTTVTILATDLYGNSSSSSFQVLVEDSESPQVLDTPSSMTLTNDAGQCAAVATWSAPGSADNCPGHTVALSHQSGDSFPVGTTEVTVTATDAAGNSTSTAFEITVLDEELPTLDPSADITVEATAESCNSELTVPAPATADNCQVASVSNDYTGTEDASGVYELGTTTITWTVTDIHGNETSATQTVTVTVDETDCNENGQPDVCEIASGSALDCNGNGTPDECETDCNGNGIPDDCDIASGTSADTNSNATPDECEQQFNRGDANASGTIDVTDPIYILQYVIGSGPAPSCMDSGDCNDDESLDLSDAIYLLQHLFLATAPPSAPYGTCGIDPDGQSIGCDSFPICP